MQKKKTENKNENKTKKKFQIPIPNAVFQIDLQPFKRQICTN